MEVPLVESELLIDGVPVVADHVAEHDPDGTEGSESLGQAWSVEGLTDAAAFVLLEALPGFSGGLLLCPSLGTVVPPAPSSESLDDGHGDSAGGLPLAAGVGGRRGARRRAAGLGCLAGDGGGLASWAVVGELARFLGVDRALTDSDPEVRAEAELSTPAPEREVLAVAAPNRSLLTWIEAGVVLRVDASVDVAVVAATGVIGPRMDGLGTSTVIGRLNTAGIGTTAVPP